MTGKREFFRYTAKEIPSIKTFHFPGIQVDVSFFSYSLLRHFFVIITSFYGANKNICTFFIHGSVLQ